MATPRFYEIAFKIAGAIAASFPKSLQTAQGQLEAVGRKVAQLEHAQGTVTRFRELHNQIDATKLKLRQAEGEMKHLGSTVGPMTAEMAKQYSAATARVEKLRMEFRAEATDLKSVNAAMAAAGVSARTLSGDQAKLVTSLAKAHAQQKRMQASQGAIAANKKQSEDARSKYDAAKKRVLAPLAATAAFVLPVKIAADFEDSIVRTGALAHASEEQLAKLSNTARVLGRDTRFSATQAAEGMGYLAQSGFKTEQIIAAMPGMLEIAAAGAVDVGEAADVTSNILHGFNMRAEQTGRLGDVLTNTFTNSSTTLSLLGESMKYVAPIAKATGASLEQTAASVGLLANAGIKGGESGTALRQMLSRLSAPRAAGRKALESLGIRKKDMEDAKGNLLPLDQVLTTINKKMSKFGTATKAGMTTAIFGMEAATAATVLLGEAGSGNLQKFTQVVSRSGTAAEVAAKQNATMKGQWDNLYGSVEDVGIQIGNVMIPTLKRLIDKMVPVVNSVTTWLQDHPKLTEAIVLGTAALGSLALTLAVSGVLLDGVKLGVLAAKGAMLLLNSATWKAVAAWTAANLPMMLYIAGIAGLALIAYQIYEAWNPISQWFTELWDDALDGLGKYMASIKTLAKVARFVPGLSVMANAVDLIPDIGTNHRAERNRRFNEEAFNRLAPYSSLGGPMREDYVKPWSMLDGGNGGGGPIDSAGKLPGPSAKVGDFIANITQNISLPPGTSESALKAIEDAGAASLKDIQAALRRLNADERRKSVE